MSLCLRRATLRPPGAEELSGAVSAHERPTAWSLSGRGPGVGGLHSWGTVPSWPCSGMLEAFRAHPLPAGHSPDREPASGSAWKTSRSPNPQ